MFYAGRVLYINAPMFSLPLPFSGGSFFSGGRKAKNSIRTKKKHPHRVLVLL
jgi:hypothetical protein